MGAHNNWTAKLAQRRRQKLEVNIAGDDTAAKPETFNELRKRAKAAGVSAAGTREAIEARLEAL